MRYDIEKVIRARMIRGWTQAKLAEVIDRSPGAISSIENGRYEPSPTTMKRIADVLGLDMDELVLEECAK
jgi:transcriptional regulator with XRE-family HTH domain